jgi:hypothetical protein
MSAFTVNKQTIDAIVTFAKRKRMYENDMLNRIGQILWDANFKSVNHRYNENTIAPNYEFKTHGLDMTAVCVLKLIACLNYQCCEFDEWPETEAFRILERIKNRAIASLPGYEEAPWGL